MLVFVHIPRTGGQSFQQLFLQNYRRKRIRFVRGSKVQELAQLSEADYDICGGHIPWGVFANLGTPVSYITILREPIARHRSEYFFQKRTPTSRWYEMIQNGFSLSDWFNLDSHSEFRVHNNTMTRYLSGAYLWSAPNRHLAARAKEVLCKMPAFGLTERFDESMLFLGRALRWEHIFVVPTNAKTQADDESVEVSYDHELFKFDRELYAFASDLFEDRINGVRTVFTEALAAYREIAERLRIEFAEYSGRTTGPRQPKEVLERLKGIGLPDPVRAFYATDLDRISRAWTRAGRAGDEKRVRSGLEPSRVIDGSAGQADMGAPRLLAARDRPEPA